MRASESERHAEALGVADHDVGAHLARRLEQGQRKQVGSDHEQRTMAVDDVRILRPVLDPATGCGVLHKHAEIVAAGELLVEGFGGTHDFNSQAHGLGTGVQHFERLRMGIAGNQEDIGFRPGRAIGQGHALGRGRGFVQQ